MKQGTTVHKSPEEIVVNHFDTLAEAYDEKTKTRKSYLDAVDTLIVDKLHEQENLVVLDVGCGTGVRTEKIAKQIHALQVYGIDISKNMVNIASKRISNVKQMSMISLDFKENTFDAIFCLFNCFGYLATYEERIKALRNMHKILKPGGLLFIDVMNMLHKGEGITFRRTNTEVIKDLVSFFLNPNVGFGNKMFTIKINNVETKGFVHGFLDFEMKWLLAKNGWNIDQKYIMGYDSGEIKQKRTEGQLFYICKKK